MQCVYILTNEHVPNLVKFGFSTRDPHDRAAELSAPTGVPGQWIVHHYWRVVDGYSTEQSIFRIFSKHRLNRQEFLRFTADEAVQAISQELQRLGTNPIEQARQREERKIHDRQEIAKRRLAERERLATMQQKLELRRTPILQKISEQQKPIQKRIDKLNKVFLIAFLVAIYAAVFYVNISMGIITAGIYSGVIVVFLIIPISFLIGIALSFTQGIFHSKSYEKLHETEAEILESHGFKSLSDLDDPQTLT